MKKFPILAFIAAVWVVPMSYAADSRPITLEDVDTDGDRKLSPAESSAFLQSLGQEKYPETQQVRPAPAPALKNAAATASPVVTATEKLVSPRTPIKNPYGEKDDETRKVPVFVQKKEEIRVDEMKTLDINQDGILQQGELNRGAAAKFSAADTNRDGILSRHEIDASINRIKAEKSEYGVSFGKEYSNRARNRYKNADTDHDGKLSPKEYEIFSKQYQQNFDRNGDGVITKDEYRGEGEKLPSSYFKKSKK